MLAPVHRSARSALVALLLLTLVALGASCAKTESTTEEHPAATTDATPAPALTDANIAAIVLKANNADIENAKLALGKTSNSAVKAFANQMVADHTSVNQQATDLATKLSLTPEDNDASHQLEENANATRKTIDEAKGAAFDKAYVDNEVAYHQAVIDMLDQTLIPGATNAELKTLLQNVRPAFEAHLDHARRVQAALAG